MQTRTHRGLARISSNWQSIWKMEIRAQCEKARNELQKTGVMNVQAAQAAPSATRAPLPPAA